MGFVTRAAQEVRNRTCISEQFDLFMMVVTERKKMTNRAGFSDTYTERFPGETARRRLPTRPKPWALS